MPLSLNDIPTFTPQIPTKNADVSYASALAGGDIMQNYAGAQAEIAMTGKSTLVEDQKTKWLQEQAYRNKMTVEELVANPNLPVATRRQVAEAYVSGSYPVKSLRDKFIIQAAVGDIANDRLGQDTQTESAVSVLDKDNESLKQEQAHSVLTGTGAMLQGMKQHAGSFSLDLSRGVTDVALTIGGKVAMSIPAGLFGAWAMMFDKEPERASQIMNDVMKESYEPRTEVGRKAMESISDWLETIDVPFKWAGDKAFESAENLQMLFKVAGNITGSPTSLVFKAVGKKAEQEDFPAQVGAGVYTAGSFIGYMGAALGAQKGLEAGIRFKVTGKKDVPVSSPMGAVETGSKTIAGDVTAKALEDPIGKNVEALGTSKDALLNRNVLPKITDEHPDILPDARAAIEKLDSQVYQITKETEYNAHITDVDTRLAEKESYTQFLTETAKPHLLLSSSVLDISPEAKLFGRAGKDYEALISASARKLEGTAVFGRNPNYGYKTQAGAAKYMKKLEEQASVLPDKGEFSLLEKDGQHYVQWKFNREYNPWEKLTFGDDALSAYLFHPRIDITRWANDSWLGKSILPNYMRMKQEVVSQGAAAGLQEGRIESVFLRAQRDLFLGTKHPTELNEMLVRGSEESKVFNLEDFQTTLQHLSQKEIKQVYSEYVGFRRIQDHLYNLTDRTFRKDLESSGMKTVYDENGNFALFSSEPLLAKDLTDIPRVWDASTKMPMATPKEGVIVKLQSPVRNGDEILDYAVLNPNWQQGPIRPGSLTKIPGYIGRNYKEWFVVDLHPNKVVHNGKTVPKTELSKYKRAIGMARNREDAELLMERFKAEYPENTLEVRLEQKNIEDKIIYDTHIYDTYLKETTKRGDHLPTLDGPARIEDPLVAQTKAIRSVSRITAWEDLAAARREQFVKAYGEFTNGQFPKQITDINPGNVARGKLSPLQERRFLEAKSIYEQFDREQLSLTMADEVWRRHLNSIADVFDKVKVDGDIVRQWGEAGFVPLRATKAAASNLYIYLKPLRQWFIQTQQWKELVVMNPSFGKEVGKIPALTAGLLARAHSAKGMQTTIDSLASKGIPEYAEIVKALEESAITQAVDMNMMVHGIWRDSAKELDPVKVKSILGVTDRVLETGSKAAAVPGKIARLFGYDPAELTNQVSLWMYAKHRWQQENPGKNWNTPNGKAAIQEMQLVIGHVPATRAGIMPWQDGLLSSVGQFTAIPHKSLMQMISSKEFTGAERTKLAAARLFWYGKYGIPTGAAIHLWLERHASTDEDKQNLDSYTQGVTNMIYNSVFHALFDKDGETTKLGASKSLATVPDSMIHYDTIHSMYQMMMGERPDSSIPLISAGNSMYEAARTVHDIFAVKDASQMTVEDYKKALWQIMSFTGTLNDYEKATIIDRANKMGKHLGYGQSSGEAAARLFAGIPPSEEELQRMIMKESRVIDKHIESRAKEMYQRLNKVVVAQTADEAEQQKLFYNYMQPLLSLVEPEYREKVTLKVLELDRQREQTTKDSIITKLTKQSTDQYDSNYENMLNMVKRSKDQDSVAFAKDLEELRSKVKGTK